MRNKLDTIYCEQETLMIFLDETGNPKFDPKNPVFGIGGCAILSNNYKKYLDKPFKKIKKEIAFLGNRIQKSVLHAADLNLDSKNPAHLRCINSINRFFLNPFYRFARLIEETAILSKGLEVTELIAISIIGDILKFIDLTNPKSILIIYENSDKYNNEVEKILNPSRIEEHIKLLFRKG